MKATERFSERAEDYARWRPGYPAELVAAMGLAPGATVADVGAGTGISSALFLGAGFHVVAVEPNAAMRAKARVALGADSKFRAVDGVAEATTLDSAGVDAVFCAQAFHWFDAARARDEFLRIARPGGVIGICWNDRVRSGSAFLDGFEALLLRHCDDYRERVSPRTVAAIERMERVFAPRRVEVFRFTNCQRLDWDGLAGRARSASYVPLEGHPEHQPYFDGLRMLFDATQTDGHVTIGYECRLYRVAV